MLILKVRETLSIENGNAYTCDESSALEEATVIVN